MISLNAGRTSRSGGLNRTMGTDRRGFGRSDMCDADGDCTRRASRDPKRDELSLALGLLASAASPLNATNTTQLSACLPPLADNGDSTNVVRFIEKVQIYEYEQVQQESEDEGDEGSPDSSEADSEYEDPLCVFAPRDVAYIPLIDRRLTRGGQAGCI